MMITRISSLVLAVCGLGLWASSAVAAPRVSTASLNVRVFFEGSKVLPYPCSAITVTAEQPGKPKITKTTVASTQQSPPPSGTCTTSFTLPTGVPLTLKAHASHLPSKPAANFPAPNGNWTNPVTLKPGINPSRYIMLYGKP